MRVWSPCFSPAYEFLRTLSSLHLHIMTCIENSWVNSCCLLDTKAYLQSVRPQPAPYTPVSLEIWPSTQWGRLPVHDVHRRLGRIAPSIAIAVLAPPSSFFSLYGNATIDLAVALSFTVCYGHQTEPTFNFQVSCPGTDLLGLDLSSSLSLALLESGGLTIQHVGRHGNNNGLPCPPDSFHYRARHHSTSGSSLALLMAGL